MVSRSSQPDDPPLWSGYCLEPSLEKWPDWRCSAWDQMELRYQIYRLPEKVIVCRSHGTPQIDNPSPRCWFKILVKLVVVSLFLVFGNSNVDENPRWMWQKWSTKSSEIIPTERSNMMTGCAGSRENHWYFVDSLWIYHIPYEIHCGIYSICFAPCSRLLCSIWMKIASLSLLESNMAS